LDSANKREFQFRWVRVSPRWALDRDGQRLRR